MEKASTFRNSLKFQQLPNGETLAYRSQTTTSAPKANLLLVHGWLSSSFSIWDDLVVLLSDLPLNIYAVDMRGFGDSTYKNSIYSIDDLAEDLNLFCKALNLNDVIIAGFSFGGGVALQYAANYPDQVKKLISFDGIGFKGVQTYYEKDGQQTLITKSEDYGKSHFWAPADMKLRNDMAAAVAFQYLGTFNCGKEIPKARVEEYVQGGFVKERHVIEVIHWCINFNLSKENNGVVEGNGKIHNIKCKCLFLHGDNDVLINVKDAKGSVEALGALAKLEIVEKSGHCPFMSNPERTAELVREFIKEELH